MRTHSSNLSGVDTNFIDKSNIFFEATSPRWRMPMKISLNDILNESAKMVVTPIIDNASDSDVKNFIDNDTLVIDPSTLKIKVNSYINSLSNVYSEPFNTQYIYHNLPPVNASSLSGMHTMTDGNYLYIWVGNRWKRTILSEW